MNRFLFYLCTFFVLTSCGTDEETNDNQPVETSSEIIGIETLFNEKEFPDPVHLELLKELKICNTAQKDTSNYLDPACSPSFFKFFQLNENIPIKNAFMLQIKSKVGGIKLRRLIVFVREKGVLVKVNGFVANLIGLRPTPSGHYDLILRFNDNVEGDIIFYNTIFKWDGKKYVYDCTETIEGTDQSGPWRQRIKEEFKDSVSKDIYATLVTNQMII